MKGADAVTDSRIVYRPELPDDTIAITDLIATAFGRPAEAQLVSRLRAAQALTVSVVAEAAGQLVAHAALSPVEIDGQAGAGRWLGLAPVAVLPGWQRRGIGTALVQAACACAAPAIFVLGGSRWYGRLGFEEAAPLGWPASTTSPPRRSASAAPALGLSCRRPGRCAITPSSTHSDRPVWRAPALAPRHRRPIGGAMGGGTRSACRNG